MKITSPHYQLNKQHVRQSFFTLLLFCVTLFFHSEHYLSVDADNIIVSFESHDCHLCQQSVDTPPNTVAVSPYTATISRVTTIAIVKVMLTATEHLYPLLRAPPTLSIIS